MAIPSSSRARVRLCAIARDEGPYLADWVFHHLHFGFDSIEVWVNGTTDPSEEILRRLGARDPRVGFRVVDELLGECLGRGRNFQHEAYARMAADARAGGFTHAAFLDLDEYWLPRDLRSSIHDFLDPTGRASVISFPWLVDVPDHDRPPYSHAVLDASGLQLDPHVKSVVALDDRVRGISVHTARAAGRRLLVRDPFPKVDRTLQRVWSLASGKWVEAHRDAVPEAFVLHAMHRSQVEYVACLAKGLRQTGEPIEFKNNRAGFVASPQPVLRLDGDPSALGDYRLARQEFLAPADVGELVAQAEQESSARYHGAMERLRADREFLRANRAVLHGVVDEELDRTAPGWDAAIRSWVDRASASRDVLRVEGWAFCTDPRVQVELGLRDGTGRIHAPMSTEEVERESVAGVFPGAPLRCGFVTTFAVGSIAGDLEQGTLVMRLPGDPVWQAHDLAHLLVAEVSS